MSKEDTETVLYYKYKQGCFGLGAMLVGITGGMGLGYLTQVYTTKPLFTVSQLPQFQQLMSYIKKFLPQSSYFIGPKNHYWVRLGLQGLGCSLVYSYIECKMQRGHHRNIIDSGFAGAVTGAIFGLRGIPGGAIGAGYGSARFALYAAIVQLVFRRNSYMKNMELL